MRWVWLWGFLSWSAYADEAPKTLELPAETVLAVRQYLMAKPYGEVVGLVNDITACISVQIPQDGKIMDHGQCPAVSAAIKQKAP